MANKLLFGRFADLAGLRGKEMDVASIAGLRRVIAADFLSVGEALGSQGVNVAINREIVRGDRPLKAGDEVALTLLSVGAMLIRTQPEPFDPAAFSSSFTVGAAAQARSSASPALRAGIIPGITSAGSSSIITQASSKR